MAKMMTRLTLMHHTETSSMSLCKMMSKFLLILVEQAQPEASSPTDPGEPEFSEEVLSAHARRCRLTELTAATKNPDVTFDDPQLFCDEFEMQVDLNNLWSDD